MINNKSKMKQFVRIGGKFIILEKDIGESSERFLERCYFILKYIEDKKENDLEESLTLSRIWANIKYDKCKYSQTVTQLINNYL